MDKRYIYLVDKKQDVVDPHMDTPSVFFCLNTDEVTYFDKTPDYVDLGLSVKWLTHNLGANEETEYGDYYQWGSEIGYNEDDAVNYCSWDTSPIAENASQTIWDDIVTNKYGDGYRLPTKTEIEELLKINHKWVANYKNSGINGLLFTSTSGNSLFIPAGEGYPKSPDTHNTYGLIWSNTVYEDDTNLAYELSFNSGTAKLDTDNRYIAINIRGVYIK